LQTLQAKYILPVEMYSMIFEPAVKAAKVCFYCLRYNYRYGMQDLEIAKFT
jgi:hypothetical protein